MSEVTFGNTMSISEFKAAHNCTKLDVKTNPTKGTQFVTANGKTVAAVSKKYDSGKEDKAFVEVITPEGDVIWTLHNPSSVNTIETL